MNEHEALTTIVESNHIDLAIAGWLDAHSRSAKTLKAYADTIQQYRGELRRIGHDLDSDIRTLAMVAQRFASFSSNPGKEPHYRNGEDVDTYRGITGAAWVAEAYDIAAENATSLMHVEGAFWQVTVDECKRLAQEYREKAAQRN